MISQDQLKCYLSYSPETGVFIWKVSRGRIRAGTVAGCVDDKDTTAPGYRKIKILKVSYHAHRLAWLYVTGLYPEEIDHCDGNRDNNRFSNLRNGNHLSNQRNLPQHRAGRPLGIHFHIKQQKWTARIGIGKDRKWLGSFDTEQEALDAYRQAVIEPSRT